MRRTAAALMTALALVTLAGCSLRPDVPAGEPSSPAPSTDGPVSVQVAAGWLEGGRTIGVVTWGSSTCVPVGGAATLEGDVISVPFSRAAGETVCTADLAPRVTLVATPAGVDPAQDYEVHVTGSAVAGDADLDGVDGLAGPGGAPSDGPSAGWTGEDDLFVIVTFGSGCRPQVQDAAATGPAEVTVTFAEPPKGQVCTMTYGPRGSVAQVTGLEDDENVTAVLEGDGLDGVRVPIVGEN